MATSPPISQPTRDSSSRQQPPAFCQYAAGPCDQRFLGIRQSEGIILYPSEPIPIASTIEGAASLLRESGKHPVWLTWRDFRVGGQIIFCEICKHMRFAGAVFADVTTLNFNLLFEIGFALGLELPVVPIRDTTYIRDKEEFAQLGMLDTLGYLDFQNSTGLAEAIAERMPAEPLSAGVAELNISSPLYAIKGPIDTEGEVKLLAALKKSGVRFRAYDGFETPRLSLHEARRNVSASLGMIAHLLDENRKGAAVHNARCALIAGLAVASGKHVLLLHEGDSAQPIDYRDLISMYRTPDQIAGKAERLFLEVIRELQDVKLRVLKPPTGLLSRLDLGDVAAENEVAQLQYYFVRTGQYHEAARGHATLVTGRKGSGKTAVFYSIRDAFQKRRSHVVVDMKPEGHQFTRLRELILSKLSPGMQEYVLTAFWNYILLCEMAQKILDDEESWSRRDPTVYANFRRLSDSYRAIVPVQTPDLSERLLNLVNKLSERFAELPAGASAGQITEVLFKDKIRTLNDVLAEYMSSKEEVWLLVDNLDKGWPTRGATEGDILILRSLLEAGRKLQRQFERRNVSVHPLVFLRNDIYELLVRETPDKGKDTPITLDWDDPEAFRQIVLNRILSATSLAGSFDEVWPAVFDTHVGTVDSFQYIVERTLMRPRDLLNFLHRAVEVAVNRQHERVTQQDIIKAEEQYSEDILLALSFELKDVFPSMKDFVYEFLGCRTSLSYAEVIELVSRSGFDAKQQREVVEMLVWFGFLGVRPRPEADVTYAYQARHNLAKLLAPFNLGPAARFVIHPAFRAALECAPSLQ